MWTFQKCLRRLPKTDLHLHLGWIPSLRTLIELAKEYNVELPAYTAEGWKRPYLNLSMLIWENITGLSIHLWGCTAKQKRCTDLWTRWDNINEGVRHRGAFCTLTSYGEGLVTEDILKAVCAGLQQAKDEYNATEAIVSGDEPPFHFGVIACDADVQWAFSRLVWWVLSNVQANQAERFIWTASWVGQRVCSLPRYPWITHRGFWSSGSRRWLSGKA